MFKWLIKLLFIKPMWEEIYKEREFWEEYFHTPGWEKVFTEEERTKAFATISWEE